MRKKLSTVVMMSLGIVLSCALWASPVRADQPLMQAALKNLRQAQTALGKATADKGGHRVKAEGLVARAMAEVNAGIAYDRATPGDRPKRKRNDLAVFAADQPFMQQAKDNLQQALNNLQNATADKGGHRENAINLVREALAEVQKGIEYDRRN